MEQILQRIGKWIDNLVKTVSDYINAMSQDEQIILAICTGVILILFIVCIVFLVHRHKMKKRRKIEAAAIELIQAGKIQLEDIPEEDDFEERNEASDGEPVSAKAFVLSGFAESDPPNTEFQQQSVINTNEPETTEKNISAQIPSELIKPEPPKSSVIVQTPDPIIGPKAQPVQWEESLVVLRSQEKEDLEEKCSRRIKDCAITGSAADLEKLLYQSHLLKVNRLNNREYHELKEYLGA